MAAQADSTPGGPPDARSSSLLSTSGIGQLTSILAGHLELMKQKDLIVDQTISSTKTASSLREAKKKALDNETSLLLSIMEDIGELNSFLENIILIENLFNSLYAPYKQQQEHARVTFAKNIEKYENRAKCTSNVSSFVELIFSGQTHLSSFQSWLDKVGKQCQARNVKVKLNSGAKVKKIERAFYKSFYVYAEEEGFKRMTDILRVSLVFDEFGDLYKCFTIIEELAEQGGILRVKDRFNPITMPFGYRDLLINIHCPGSSIVAEIQLHFNVFYEHKKVSHSMYKLARLFERETGNLAYEYSTQFKRPKIGTFKVYEAVKEEANAEDDEEGGGGGGEPGADGNDEAKAEETKEGDTDGQEVKCEELLTLWGLEQFIQVFRQEGWDECVIAIKKANLNIFKIHAIWA